MLAAATLAENISGWRPGFLDRVDTITSPPVAALAALFDTDADTAAGAPLPPLWHQLFCLDRVAQSELGEDGHPRIGTFLPPIPDRRRMFAGGSVEVRAPLRLGETITKRSRIKGSQVKNARSGQLLFVTEEHEFSVSNEVRVNETTELVYRSQATADRAVQPSPALDTQRSEAQWRWQFDASPTALFRFSALTYNAHRIHYDLPYARDVEGFPGLLVHGPLLALAMLELPRRQETRRVVTSFKYRINRPLFAGQTVAFSGEPGKAAHTWQLEASGPGGPAAAGQVSLE